MTRDTARLIEEALELPEEDRARLAGTLLRSLDARPESLTQDEYETAWSDEIGRRLQGIDDGSVKPVGWEVARRTISADE
jgi:putative addiction module component (TIGR02574 family)